MVYPQDTTTYTLSAFGPGSRTTESVTVTVTLPLPTLAISATPDVIQPGEPAMLNWSSTDAYSCEIQPDIGTVNLSGWITVDPTETTTYTITAIGDGGMATASATVTVNAPSSIVQFIQLENTGGLGRYLSLDIDELGNPRATYSTGDRTLRYAYFTGSGFEFEDVASNVLHNSLALDSSDIPGVIYSYNLDNEALFQDREGGIWSDPYTLHSGYGTGRWPNLRFALDGTAYAIFWSPTRR